VFQNKCALNFNAMTIKLTLMAINKLTGGNHPTQSANNTLIE
jgi:hypothetical protein